MKRPVDLSDAEEEIEPEVEEVGHLTKMIFKTNRNMGNMEHQSIELEYTMVEGEDTEEVFKYLQDEALYLLYLEDEGTKTKKK